MDLVLIGKAVLVLWAMGIFFAVFKYRSPLIPVGLTALSYAVVFGVF